MPRQPATPHAVAPATATLATDWAGEPQETLAEGFREVYSGALETSCLPLQQTLRNGESGSLENFAPVPFYKNTYKAAQLKLTGIFLVLPLFAPNFLSSRFFSHLYLFSIPAVIVPLLDYLPSYRPATT